MRALLLPIISLAPLLGWTDGPQRALHGMTAALDMFTISILAQIFEQPFEELFVHGFGNISIAYIVLLLLSISAFAITASAPCRWPQLIPMTQYLLPSNTLYASLAGCDIADQRQHIWLERIELPPKSARWYRLRRVIL
jgi:hypothetical protein